MQNYINIYYNFTCLLLLVSLHLLLQCLHLRQHFLHLQQVSLHFQQADLPLLQVFLHLLQFFLHHQQVFLHLQQVVPHLQQAYPLLPLLVHLRQHRHQLKAVQQFVHRLQLLWILHVFQHLHQPLQNLGLQLLEMHNNPDLNFVYHQHAGQVFSTMYNTSKFYKLQLLEAG